MTYTVGETVVYPNHGTAVIEDIETRKIKGEDRLYLVLRVVGQTDLVVRVPACNLDLIGVRDVVDEDGLERVFDILRMTDAEEPANWSRRFKANIEKVNSGNVIKVAEVVRDLWRRERSRGLSAGEKRMLAKARQNLVAEIALAEHVDETKAEETLDDILLKADAGAVEASAAA
jgi:CarD family transcriptional regulator